MVTAKQIEANERKWRELVEHARSLLVKRERVRFKIAQIAIEACDIRQGGGDDRFSIARFAREIKIPKTTLAEWIRCKRQVVDKLPVKVQQNIHEVPYNLLDRCLKKVDSDMKAKDVHLLFRREADVNTDVIKFQKYASGLNSILFNAKKPTKLAGCPTNLIQEMLQKSQEISKYLNKELAFRKKYGQPSRSSDEKKFKEAVNRVTHLHGYR